MMIGERFLDAKTRTIYKVTEIERNLTRLTAEDGSGQIVI